MEERSNQGVEAGVREDTSQSTNTLVLMLYTSTCTYTMCIHVYSIYTV